MTSRRLVVDSLEFRSPARVPRQLWLLPWAERTWPAELAAIRKRFPDDIVTCPAFLPYGTPADVAAAVRRVRRALWREGGCIAQCEFGIGARPENVAAVFEAWYNYAG